MTASVLDASDLAVGVAEEDQRFVHDGTGEDAAV
jgi:hypothetical protein